MGLVKMLAGQVKFKKMRTNTHYHYQLLNTIFTSLLVLLTYQFMICCLMNQTFITVL